MGRPPKGSRNWLAWNRAEEALADGEWHYTSNVVSSMMEAGGIVKKTAVNLLSEAVGYGVVERKGLKQGFRNGGYVDRRMVRSIPAKQERFERERAGHVGEQDRSASPLRGEASHVTSDRAAAETPSRVEYERNKSTRKSRPQFVRPSASSANDDVDLRPQPVNPPDKVFTEAEARALQNMVRRRRRPPDGH